MSETITIDRCGKCGGRVYFDDEDQRYTCFMCAVTIAYLDDGKLTPCPVPPQSLAPKPETRSRNAPKSECHHGTTSGYIYHSCRCRECSTAYSIHRRHPKPRPKAWAG